MKALIQPLPMVPESYQDDSFDIVVRDTQSVAVFWDLAATSRPSKKGSRLSLQVFNENSGESEILILNHQAGHMIVPLEDDARSYKMELGWSDAKGFRSIAENRIELPPLKKTLAHHEPFFSRVVIERRGFRPATDL